MKIPILIEVTPERRYRASVCEPLIADIEGDSPQAVMQKVQEYINERVAQGAVIAALDVPNGENPWLDGIGMFRDDPLFDEWQRAIAENRRDANQQADTP
jgi:hypothetical protein